jgi:hypothetical protein
MASTVTTATHATEPNPPTWPPSVTVFDPSMSNEDISAVVEAAYAINGGDPRTTECGNGEVRSLPIERCKRKYEASP